MKNFKIDLIKKILKNLQLSNKIWNYKIKLNMM